MGKIKKEVLIIEMHAKNKQEIFKRVNKLMRELCDEKHLSMAWTSWQDWGEST